MTRGQRHTARIAAVQHLYGCEMRAVFSSKGLEECLDLARVPPHARAFATELAEATLSRLSEIDALLGQFIENWNLPRLAATDRAILRVAAAELTTRQDIPAAVTINEAIEMARELGTNDSPRFVNGVLDRIRLHLGRPSRSTAPA